MKSPDFSFLTDPAEYNSLTMILFSIVVGTVIAAVAMLYRQLFLGGIVRKILAKKAHSEEDAISIEDMGYSKKNFLIKYALRNKSTFSKIVLRTNEKIPRYYIPEERRLREEIRFRKKGNSFVTIILMILAFVGIAYILLTVIPYLRNEVYSLFE